MNHRSHEVSLSILYTCLKNLAVVVLFVILAIRFHLWWLSLFSLLFQQRIKTVIDDSSESNNIESNLVRCDYCGELLYVKDIEHAVHEEFELHHWHRLEVAGKWRNICPSCVEKYRPKLDDTP